MTEVRGELVYTEEHEWLRREEDGSVTIGITDHAQEALGELVFVELPEVGAHYGESDACAVVESVKAASDVYSPLSGEVTAVNAQLEDTPELINSSAYDDGWVLVMRPDDISALDGMMDANAYEAFVAALED